ncbi:stage II sporulation protein M [Desulfurispora thermophila]|uniref:stage II sporulation protein M n=1 Tax=Desulfurispora thermophila TaxID=265470 RepID=UPI00036709CC|nr:stage II sporulation protein M [Desulfurispora thermophila]
MLRLLASRWLLWLFLVLIFAGGAWAGYLYLHSLPPAQLENISAYLLALFKQAGSGEARTGELHRLITSNILFTLLIYLLGVTVIAVPVLLLLLFGRGFALGFTVGYLLEQYPKQGFLLAICAILPQHIFYLTGLFLAVGGAAYFSLVLTRRWFDSRQPVLPFWSGYSCLMLLVLGLNLLGGMAEVYVTPWCISLSSKLIL